METLKSYTHMIVTLNNFIFHYGKYTGAQLENYSGSSSCSRPGNSTQAALLSWKKPRGHRVLALHFSKENTKAQRGEDDLPMTHIDVQLIQ